MYRGKRLLIDNASFPFHLFYLCINGCSPTLKNKNSAVLCCLGRLSVCLSDLYARCLLGPHGQLLVAGRGDEQGRQGFSVGHKVVPDVRVVDRCTGQRVGGWGGNRRGEEQDKDT